MDRISSQHATSRKSRSQKKKKNPQRTKKTRAASANRSQRKPLKRKQSKFLKKLQRAKQGYDNIKNSRASIISMDKNFDPEEFLEGDIRHVNQEEAELQRELYEINKLNYCKIKNIEAKYNINTNYTSSNQLISKNPTLQNQKQGPVNEMDLKESIARLDEYLLRKKIQSQKRLELQA